MRLYVYYRVAPQHAADACAAFVAACGAASVELLCRPGVQDGLQTWMEVYGDDDVTLEPAVAAAMQAWLAGPRHVEAFEPVRLA
jgi:hypothetical protein